MSTQVSRHCKCCQLKTLHRDGSATHSLNSRVIPVVVDTLHDASAAVPSISLSGLWPRTTNLGAAMLRQDSVWCCQFLHMSNTCDALRIPYLVVPNLF